MDADVFSAKILYSGAATRCSELIRRHVGEEAIWPPLELREIEHSLCEFDKYERVRLGEGKPKQ